ncbi:hypothetical protein GDO78_008808 [Eleutherodactylus coqui]|uniref:Uncharacterized protein n=1 Tax=Eleutherodactylus coqui TaxID=57060 RepID=A0A8J6KAL2_ELECQ|nr:hypothetical protein GDO78_008808 [Eleutherodactylus coqui]
MGTRGWHGMPQGAGFSLSFCIAYWSVTFSSSYSSQEL